MNNQEKREAIFELIEHNDINISEDTMIITKSQWEAIKIVIKRDIIK